MRDGRLDATENLLRDEALLERGEAASRVAVLRGPVVSLGVGQPANVAAARRAHELGIPVVRRRSGGTGLLHLEGDLVWSVVLPRTDPRTAEFTRGYARLGEAVVAALRDLRVAAAWRPAFGAHEPYCLLASRGQVLAVAGRALGGAAQHLSRRALLHHGTVNVRIDRPRLAALFDVPAGPLERRVTCLTELPGAPAPELLASALAARLSAWVLR